jgi:SET domain-containing protein
LDGLCRDIKAGEEVTRAYVDVEGKSKEDRAALLKKSHGFKCNCKACGAATVA